MRISQALRNYAADKNIDALIDIAARELCPPAHSKIRFQFRLRIPEAHRKQFDESVATFRQRVISTDPKDAPPPLDSPGVSKSYRQNLMAKQQTARKPTDQHTAPSCPKCGRAFTKDPFKSSCCNTLACYSCWLAAIALKQCHFCNKPVKKSMLHSVTLTHTHRTKDR